MLETEYAFEKWSGIPVSELNVAATYNLAYNASLMAEEGMGYVITLDKLINVTGESSLCFRYFDPPMKIDLNIVRKKHQIFSKPAELFFEHLRKMPEFDP